MERFLDIIYLLYFGSHIPIALCFDSQALFPRWLYPKQLTDVMDWYTSEFGDVMMKHKPAWFQSFIFCEMFLQFPFFFVAFYAYWKGISKCRWIRLPMIVYSSHVVTSLLCIYSHVFFYDFASDKHGGPKTMKERIQLASFYFPYFVVPVLLLLDSIFSPVYVTGTSGATGRRKGGKSN